MTPTTAALQSAGRRPDLWRRYGVTVLAVGAAVLLKLVVASWVERESPFLLFLAAVMVSAWYGGAGPGLLATGLAALASDFFFMEPLYSFSGYNRQQGVRLAQFVLEGAVISLLGGALHRARQRAETSAAGERAAREEAEAAHEEAETARTELAKEYEKQHRIAETLQRSLLLKMPVARFDGLEVASFYEPALDEAKVGGDFYDAFALPGGRVALVIGDVSGKGLGAAARTAEVKFALRALLHEDTAPERALARLNRFVCGQCRGERATGEEGADNRFIALSLAVIDPADGETRLVVAGTEPPLVVRADTRARIHEASAAGGLPLGVEADADYPVASLVLAPGDMLLFVTDGVTEARSPGAPATFLDSAGLVALVGQARRDAGEPVTVMGQRILDGVKRFAGGSLRDDACVLLARRR